MTGYGPDQDDDGSGLPSFEELTGQGSGPIGGGADLAETAFITRRMLGIMAPRSTHGRRLGQEPLPDVAYLARELGLHG